MTLVQLARISNRSAPNIGWSHGGEVADKPEEQARTELDQLLGAAEWPARHFKKKAIFQTARGSQFKSRCREIDYWLYVDGKIADDSNVDCGICWAKTKVTEAGGGSEVSYSNSRCDRRLAPV